MDLQPPELLIQHSDCRILSLVFDVREAFFDLDSHCCICGTDFKISGVKTSLCSNQVCLFSFRDIGFGSSVVGELGRNLAVTHLVLSLASVAEALFREWAANPAYPAIYPGSMTHLPSTVLLTHADFFDRLPSVHSMAFCVTDVDLKSLVAAPEFEISRSIFLSLPAQLFSLPDKMKLRECAENIDQFFVAMSSTEREFAFRQKKEPHGANYLWYDSPATSLLFILQKSLRLSTQEIVWYSSLSTISFEYSEKDREIRNKYRNSRRKGSLLVIGFADSAKGRGLQHEV
jgi:hypothetical protein